MDVRPITGQMALLPAVLVMITPQVLVGLLALLLLLFGLLVWRVVARSTSPQTYGRPAFGGTGYEEEAPETTPRGTSRDNRRPPLPYLRSRDALPRPHIEALPPTDPVSETPRQQPRPRPGDILKVESLDPESAANQWEQIGRWSDALRCHLRLKNNLKAGRLLVALGRKSEGLTYLREALRAAPSDEGLRRMLFSLLLDVKKTAEAHELVSVVMAPDSPSPASTEFLEAIGSDYEGAGMEEKATEFYRAALERHSDAPFAQQRLMYLRQLDRLRRADVRDSSPAIGPGSLLDELEEDSAASALAASPPERKEEDLEESVALRGKDILVGHLAVGLARREVAPSVQSVFAPSRRFRLEAVVGETERSVVFRARDRLIDHPVALKLYRLSPGFREMETLRDRLVTIAHLYHPNIAKVSYVDRDGSILRVATEYLPGGNLADFLLRMGGVGLPLVVRMALNIASALQYAHSTGVPHGDIRPENLIIGPDQRLKLVDFALSPIPVIKTRAGSAVPTSASAGIQSDMLQFADVLEFMLQQVRPLGDTAAMASAENARSELQTLMAQLRDGTLTSALRLWQSLQDTLERTTPTGL